MRTILIPGTSGDFRRVLAEAVAPWRAHSRIPDLADAAVGPSGKDHP